MIVRVRVPLPFDQILDFAPSSVSSGVQNLFDFVLLFSVDQIGRGLRKIRSMDVTDPPVTLTRKVDPGLQDLQTRAQRILAERNAEKAEEKTWIGRMVAAESIGELDGLIKSRAA